MVATGFFVNYRNNRANNVQQAERCQRGMRAAGERGELTISDIANTCGRVKQRTNVTYLQLSDGAADGTGESQSQQSGEGKKEMGDGSGSCKIASCKLKL